MEVTLGSQFGVLLVLCLVLRLGRCSGTQYKSDNNAFTTRDMYCDQPIFVSLISKSEDVLLVDHICITLFPLPDDPDTFMYYQSVVYCDGSNSVLTHIITQSGVGQTLITSKYHTLRSYDLGYAGCDIYVEERVLLFGDNAPPSQIFGVSPKGNTIGLSCLRKIEELISNRGLPESEYYVMPMKLPNRCVTQQLCLQPPNPFYNNLPSVAVF